VFGAGSLALVLAHRSTAISLCVIAAAVAGVALCLHIVTTREIRGGVATSH
jgi:hypothetical protein